MATIAWVWVVIRTRVDALGLSPELKRVLEQLIAGLYLVRVAAKARSGRTRRHHRVAEGLLAQARSGRPLATLPAEQREALEREAAWCADLFQRSSSCVEGERDLSKTKLSQYM